MEINPDWASTKLTYMGAEELLQRSIIRSIKFFLSIKPGAPSL